MAIVEESLAERVVGDMLGTVAAMVLPG